MEETRQVSTRKKLFRWLKVVVIVYCCIGIAIYYLQDAFLLHPIKVPQNEQYSSEIPFKEVNIAYDKDININIVQFSSATSTPKGVILYFHGNKNNIKRYERFVPNLTKHGYEVWMIDYPGFGKSTGNFSEALVYEWSLLMYKLARKKYTPDSIIIYGKSLGSGIGTQLASVRDCKMLILETPYYSMTSLAGTYLWMYPTHWIIRYKIPTGEYLKKVTAPVIFFHGTDDGVIPYSNAVRLKTVMKKGD